MEILLAPNGKPSNLSPEQHKLVRTPEFIAWFGDFEKANILNLLNRPITIVNNHKERNFDYEKSYIKLHRLFKIDKDGKIIQLSRSGLKHICRHAKPDVLFSSIDYLPEILKNAIKIEEEENHKLDLKPNIKKFWVYLSNFIFEGEEYVYRITVQEENDGDLIIHDTGVIKKESILKTVHAKPSYRANQNALCKDRKILDITNNIIENLSNVSKAVDENGEPLVVYHGSKSFDINEFDLSKSKRKSSGLKEFGTYFTDNLKLAIAYQNWSELKPEEEKEIDIQILKWQKILEKSRNNRDYEKAEEQIKLLKKSKKGKIYEVFLNLKKMEVFNAKGQINIEAWNNLEVKASYKWAKNRDAMDFLKEGKFGVEKVDGIKAENIVDAFVQTEDLKKELLGNAYLVFDSKNIKLADGTNTTFDMNNPDIRFDGGGNVNDESETFYERTYADGTKTRFSVEEYEKNIYPNSPILLAPNGKPSNLNAEQYKLVRSNFFKAFFGDWEKLALAKINDSGIDDISLKRLEDGVSKIVDENGEPLVCVHYSDFNFNFFDVEKQRDGWLGKGFYFSNFNNKISLYGEYEYLSFLNIKNPFKIAENKLESISPKSQIINNFNGNRTEIKEILIKNKYDGLIMENTFLCFYSYQIKLADGTNTTFDSNNDDIRFEDGGFVSYKDKFNKKFGYPKDKSHNLEQISKDTNVSLKGLQQIYNKGIGAFKTNPSSVRPTVKSKEQWAMARVYSAVMGGKAAKIDSNELKMKTGGEVPDNYIYVVNNFGSGEVLNKVFNEWKNIQSEKDQSDWSMRTKLLRFGTYQQFTLLDVMEKFDFDKSDKINGILKRDFKKEVENAYDNEIITINKNNEMKKESETFGGGGGVNDNFPIVKLKIYANNPSYNKRYFESEALFDFSNEKIKFINIDTFGDDYRFNWIKVKENSKGFYIDFEYYGGRIYIENYINLFDQEKNKKKLAGGGGVAAKSSHTLNSNKGKIAINLDKKWSDIEILLVPISFLSKCSEFNRRNDPKYSLEDSAKNIENIKKSFIENGITEPLILSYIKNESKLLLLEGNHRLNALIELEVPYYPVCVTTIDSWAKGKGKGVKTKIKPYFVTEIGRARYTSVDNFEGAPFVNMENNHVDVNETDTLTINVPLLIRLFEYIREDVDNDAQIHFLTENLLKLKNKPELSMIDYDSIINGVKLKKTAEKILALGGLAEGPPHSKGGIPLVVKSTGQNIEIEGGELVVNKFSSSETEKFEFEGKELTPCEIVSELNSMDNNGVQIDCNKIVGRFKK
jgi:hypothetical protein